MSKEIGNLIALPYSGTAIRSRKATLLLDQDSLEPIGENIQENLETFIERLTRLSDVDVDGLLNAMGIKPQPGGCQGGSSSTEKSAILLPQILEQCTFLKRCRDDAATLPEPLWYAMLSNLARTPGGITLCHQFSQGHPGYSSAETNQKVMQALDASGPHTCSWIKSNGFDCGQTCGVKAPVGLLHRALSQEKESPVSELDALRIVKGELSMVVDKCLEVLRLKETVYERGGEMVCAAEEV